jgi:hypothetical protein
MLEVQVRGLPAPQQLGEVSMPRMTARDEVGMSSRAFDEWASNVGGGGAGFVGCG